MKSTFWFWVFAVILTFSAAVYQRTTGPTYPKRVTFNLDQKVIKAKLLRSSDNDKECKIELKGIDTIYSATLVYRLYPSNKEWIIIPFTNSSDSVISAVLPSQPAAGKLEYFIEIKNKLTNEIIGIEKATPVIIRFKDHVPAWVIIPHIIFIFCAMLFSNLAGALATFKHPRFKFYGVLTLIALLIGGFIFGPLLQKYAFGELWTGFPFGFDLTDNKTLIALIAWLIAYYFNRKQEKPYLYIIAAVVMLVVFSIPHSLWGSQLNHETGEVVTGFIQLYI